MKSKAAIHVEPGGPLVIDEIDIPDPGTNQVTVRNFASGVCYSQVHQLRNPGLPRPMGLGHEGSGVVTRVGKDVTHVREGDHVISTWVPRSPVRGLPVSKPTGATFQGREVIADGDVYTWSEHMVTFADKVVPMSPSDPVDNPGGVDYAFDAVGVPTTALQSLDAVKQGGPRADNQGGMAVLLGIPVSDVSVDLNAILLYQRHYCGSLGATEPDTDFPLFLEWMRDGKFPLGKLVTNRYSLEQVDEARIALEEGQILGRAIIEL